MRLDYRDVNNCILRLPDEIVLRLKTMPDRLFLAGGFIRAVISGETISDIDLFVPSMEAAREVESLQPNPSKRVHTQNATTLFGFDLDVQVIHRWVFPSPRECIQSFDFTICSAAIWWDGERWDSRCDPRFYADLAAKRLSYLRPERDEDAGGSLLRVLKYARRGYFISRTELALVIARAMVGIDTSDEQVLAGVVATLLHVVDPPRGEDDEQGIRSLLKS